jgi:hypothetical protein
VTDETTAEIIARLQKSVQAASAEAGEWEEQLDLHRATRPEQPDQEWLRIEGDLEASRQEALRQLNRDNDLLKQIAMGKAAADKADPLSQEANEAIDREATNERLPPLTGHAEAYDVFGEAGDPMPLPPPMMPNFDNFPKPDGEEPTEVMYQAEPDPLTVDTSRWRRHPLLVGGGAIALVAVIGLGIGLAMGGNGGPAEPTFAPTPGPTETPPLTFGPTATPEPATPEPTFGPTATPAPAGYFIGPLQVKRDPGSTTTLYTLTAMGLPSDAVITWKLVAPCGSLAPANFSAYASWQQSATKACSPGPQGPFPGEVTVTVTTPRGSISFSASSETGTVGEETAIP